MSISVAVRRLSHAADLPLPTYETAGAAGMDLRAAIDDDIILSPSEHVLVPTGLEMALPPGYEGQVRPRSGLAFRHGVTVLNSPGTIDADYRGEIAVLLINLGQQSVRLKRGDRIAQLVIAPVVQCVMNEVGTLPETARGASGFGSTGGVA